MLSAIGMFVDVVRTCIHGTYRSSYTTVARYTQSALLYVNNDCRDYTIYNNSA